MIKKLEVTCFLSIGHIHLKNLDKADIIGITGEYEGLEGYSNGSGKSSLAESIAFAFTGEHRYSIDGKAVRRGQDLATVRLVFVAGKTNIEIERLIKIKDSGKTVTTATIKVGNNIKADTTTTTNKYINKFFAMTKKDLFNSSFFKQKEFDKIIKAKSAERIKDFEEFFEADLFDRAKKYSLSKRSSIQSYISFQNNSIEGFEEELKKLGSKKTLETKKLEKSLLLKGYEKELEEAKKNLGDAKNDLYSKKAEIG